MNTISTAVTRPRMASGVASGTTVLRTKTLTRSAAPRMASAASDRAKFCRQREDDGGEAEDGDREIQRAAHAALQREIGEHDRHDDGADRRRRAQDTEADGADLQDVLGEDGKQRGDAAQQHGEQIQADGAEQQRLAPDQEDARDQAGPVGCFGRCRRRPRLQRKHQQDRAPASSSDRDGIDRHRQQRIEQAAEGRADDERRSGSPRSARRRRWPDARSAPGPAAWRGRPARRRPASRPCASASR